MGSISNFLENELLDHIFNAAYTPPSTVYLALFESDPTDAGSGTETSYTGYAREVITFGAAASRRVTQSGGITFGQSSGSTVTITHWALFDAVSAGNIMAHGAFGTSKQVANGSTPSVATTEVYVEFSAGELSDYLANALLDFAFRNQAFAQPSTYVGLATATIGDSDTGSTVTEPAGNGYARTQVNVNGGASPTWNNAASGLVDNADQIDIGPPSGGAWGTIVASFIADAASGGNLLFYDNTDTVDQAIADGDTVNFPAGDLDATLD